MLEFSIPGQFSVDFPPEFPANQNVYDSDHYTKWPSFTLAQFYWDYKKRTLIFWQDILGTLKMHINIHKVPEAPESDIFDKNQFIAILDKVNRIIYEVPANQNTTESGLILPDNYESVYLKDGVTAIRYVVEGGRSYSDHVVYAMPLNEDHFIVAMFFVMVARDENYKNWYDICRYDINKIMSSFKLAHFSRKKL